MTISGVGSLFETFDFYLFSLFAIAIGASIFGGKNSGELIWVFLAFASGYLARIAGAVFFGYIGDKYGRKLSFQYTILIISFSSILIGMLPTFSMVGYTAIVLLFILRIAQGFSYGGELAGAVILVREHIKDKPGFYCGSIQAFAGSGVLLAVISYSILNAFLAPEQMVIFGWRIAFIVGGVIVLHSYFARKSLYESPEYLMMQKKQREHNQKAMPLKMIFAKHKKMLLLSILMLSGTVTYYGVSIAYMPVFCEEFCPLMTNHVTSLLLSMSVCIPVGALLGGFLSDRFGYRRTYLAVSILGLFSVLPAFSLLTADNAMIQYIYIAMIFYAFCVGLLSGIFLRYLTENFPVEVRYSGTAISMNIAFALFAGLSPVAMATLMPLFDITLLPAYVMMVAFIIQIVALVLIERRNKTPVIKGE